MNSRYNKSFNYSQRSSSNDFEEGKPSVLFAINQLKANQHKIYQERNKFKVLNRHLSRQKIMNEERQRKKELYSSVRQSYQRDKSIKKMVEKKKLKQLENRANYNQRTKERNQEMLQKIKRSFFQANHRTYEQIRQRREKNQEVVMSFRKDQLSSKRQNRQKLSQKEDLRRKSISNFYNSRIKQIQRKNQDEALDFLKKSQSREQYCNKIRLMSSRIKDSRVSQSREHSKESITNPEKTIQSVVA